MRYSTTNYISITQLQKLSLKKLRKVTLPLFVQDQKSKRQCFVIADMKSFEERLLKPEVRPRAPKKIKAVGKIPDYQSMGLLWDRPHLTNRQFHQALKDPRKKEHLQAVQRLLEYAPSTVVKKILSLDELTEAFPKLKLKPIYQEAWSRALHYWSENP